MDIDYSILAKNIDNTLRDYQKENKLKIYKAWNEGKSVMLQMPTGTGKTRLFVSIINDLFHFSRENRKAVRVLILVHRTELIDQIDNELGFKYGLAHGIIQSGDRERKHYPFQLASVQTLSRRLDKWSDKEFDFIIVDEAHHVKADSYLKIIKTFPNARVLGVTATPVRLNGQGFTDVFQELIVSPSVKHFIDEGYLSKYEYYSVAHSSFIQKEIDGIKKFNQGDYAESELVRVCDNDRIRAEVVKAYLDFANGKKGIVYTINKIHNKNLCEQFKANGIKAVVIDSDTPRDYREQCIEQFKRGEYQIICNVNLFTEGFDCPNIEFIQLARPTKSLALYLQQVGRGLRVSENKEKTIFIDNVGLYNRFGFPASKRMWRHHFEGKYLGNKTEEEVEGKYDISKLDFVKGKRKQNLEEGHEVVHLIQTTDEKIYLEQRKKEFLNWIKKFAVCYVIAINDAYKAVYREGFELKEKSGQRFIDFIEPYEISINKITPEIEEDFKTSFFHFSKKDDINTSYEWRLCKNYKEYENEISYHFNSKLNNQFKSVFNDLSEEYKAKNFTYSELSDFLPELLEANEPILLAPNCIERKSLSLSHIILICWIYSFSHATKKYQIYNPLLKLTVDFFRNEDTSITTKNEKNRINKTYEHFYEYYCNSFDSIRQAKINGEIIVAKPVLMLSIIDCIEEGIFDNNRFVLNDRLEQRYESLMKRYTKKSQFDGFSPISNPFWHLATDGFWHLKLKGETQKGITPSTKWLKENVIYASFDDDLWTLLQNKEWREKLREYIIAKKLQG